MKRKPSGTAIVWGLIGERTFGEKISMTLKERQKQMQEMVLQWETSGKSVTLQTT